MISVVVPAYREAGNLPVFYERLAETMEKLDLEWELIVVDDGSRDRTFETISEIAEGDPRVSGIRLSRNNGAYVAAACGMEHASGECVVVMAADLQDPPETIPSLLERWAEGTHVVWAARRRRHGEKTSTILLSRAFYFIMRKIVGLKEMPPRGADFLLMDRLAVDAYLRFQERNASMMALITWMGFRQEFVEYDKASRLTGQSGWSLGKKIKLALDSITSFTYLPIRLMNYLGLVVAFAGFIYAIVVFFHWMGGSPVRGWASLMVVILLLGGVQMMMLGVLGEYLWRALDEARDRPRFLIEERVGGLDEFEEEEDE